MWLVCLGGGREDAEDVMSNCKWPDNSNGIVGGHDGVRVPVELESPLA